MKVTFNGADEAVASIEALALALDRFDREALFELWVTNQDGRAITMLRNREHAWLMYLRFAGDSGVVTKGDPGIHGTCAYTLSNGQVDEYPLSWCIDLEQGYKAIAYFFVNDGARYDFVPWQEA